MELWKILAMPSGGKNLILLPVCFLYLAEHLLFLVTHHQGYVLTTKALVVEWHIFQQGKTIRSANSLTDEGAFEKAVDVFDIFSENLSHLDKGICVSTLRILCYYESLNGETSIQPVEKKMQTEVSPTPYAEIQRNNVLHILFFIEDTPLSISTNRKVNLSISKIQGGFSIARICEAYIPVLLNRITGIFHNRFSYL